MKIDDCNQYQHSYKVGVLGVFSLLLFGCFFLIKFSKYLNNDIKLIPFIAFIILSLTSIIMVSSEIFFLKKRKFIQLHPFIKKKRYYLFFYNTLLSYFSGLILVFLIKYSYKYINIYKSSNSGFYKNWFYFYDIISYLYIYFAWLYIIIISSFFYNKKKVNLHRLFIKTFIAYKKKRKVQKFNRKWIFLIQISLVKLFFLPLMTVFFCNQLGALSKNILFILDLFVYKASMKSINIHDFFNICTNIIFYLDVGIAFIGYSITSSLIQNDIKSVQPYFSGWFVALFCYPPFNANMNIFFNLPPEHAIFQIKNDTLLLIFTVLSILSYLIYLSATISLGIRFSNLTNRGIITNGIYSIVRHPAYTSKNISWWLIMFPFIIYEVFIRNQYSKLLFIPGLIFLSFLYYMRAITEEKHLSMDKDYVIYCQKVKYRFIPGVL